MRVGCAVDRAVRSRQSGSQADDRGATHVLGALAAVAAGRPVRGAPLAQALSDAQRGAGNRAVQRLVAATPIQRYAVGAPATASCDQVLNWIGTHSPYKPEAAHTTTRYSASRAMKVEGEPRDYRVSLPSPDVKVSKSVDMPMWNPTGAMKNPWAAAWAQLRAHEATHEKVGDDTRDKMQTYFANATYAESSNTPDKAKQDALREVDKDWKDFLDQEHTDQANLDPYEVVIDCPAE